MVKHLVEAGADINYRDASGFTPFLQACSKGNLETAKYFVSLGVDINQKNSLINASGFYLAAEKEHFPMMKYLQSLGADVNCLVVKGVQSYPALLMCSQKGNLELVKWLLEHGADINIKCQTAEKNPGIRVIHHAAGFGHLEIVEYLLSKGASVHDKDNNLQSTPLIFAAATGKTAIVQLLLNHGANVNERRGDGCFPLYIASQNGHAQTVHVLLQAGAQPTMHWGKISPMAIAKQRKHMEVAKVIAKYTKEDCLVM
jgi:ankyrin repeat protein